MGYVEMALYQLIDQALAREYLNGANEQMKIQAKYDEAQEKRMGRVMSVAGDVFSSTARDGRYVF